MIKFKKRSKLPHLKEKSYKPLLDTPSLIKDPDYQKKILLIDLETAPNLGSYFELWREGNILWTFQHWYILCFGWKWLGEKETHIVALPDFKIWKKDKTNDEELVKVLWDLFNKAEIIIAQNGDRFDIRKSNARFLKWRLEPPSPYKTIDTLKIARKYFKLDSNKLDDLGDYLGIGRKLRTEKGLWKDCMEGNLKAWKYMKEYNKQDVILLEKVYYKLRGWQTNSPNMNLIYGSIFSCPTCGSSECHKRGYGITRVNTYQRWQCQNCGAWSRGSIIKRDSVLR